MLCVALVLSLWHAPIPWVHVHDLEGPQVERLQLLSQHVADFHARDLGQGAARLAWHAHLVLPWCLINHSPCPEGDEREPGSDDFLGNVKISAARAVAGDAIGQPSTRAFLAGDQAADQLLIASHSAGAMAALGAPALGRHFFETYGRSDAVRDLVGVRLC
jgi:hypothetical protein